MVKTDHSDTFYIGNSATNTKIIVLLGKLLYFCASQRTPTACPCCAGSISTIGLRSFLLKVSGSNSLLSFCCTSLVSGLIIQEEARFVYWQTAQRINFVFVQC